MTRDPRAITIILQMKTLERILITVRTYPTISTKYMETVCTGGITDKGQWRRLYPVPLRYMDKAQQYSTFDIIEVDVEEAKDGRAESRRPHNPSLKVVGSVKGWQERHAWVGPTIHESLAAMRAAGRTLAPVAVREVQEFIAEKSSTEWTPEQLAKLKEMNLYEERRPLEKIPFEFRFRWLDNDGQEHNSMILSWEFGQTWRKYHESYADPIVVMRDKWMNDLCGPDRQVSFFMGNLAQRRQVFTVCGVYGPPKKELQQGNLW
jgi:hypothetical protein